MNPRPSCSTLWNRSARFVTSWRVPRSERRCVNGYWLAWSSLHTAWWHSEIENGKIFNIGVWIGVFYRYQKSREIMIKHRYVRVKLHLFFPSVFNIDYWPDPTIINHRRSRLNVYYPGQFNLSGSILLNFIKIALIIKLNLAGKTIKKPRVSGYFLLAMGIWNDAFWLAKWPHSIPYHQT